VPKDEDHPMQMPKSRTIADLLDEMAARYPGREAIVYRDERLTYVELRGRVRRLAKGLYRLGVRRGDKVALLMGNQTEWLLVDYAVTLLGATLVSVNTWYKTHELAHVLKLSEASFLVAVDRYLRQDYMPMLAEIGINTDRLPLLRQVVCQSERRFPGVLPFAELWELGAAVSDAEIDAAQRAVTKDDIAYILFTSGTTSMPKGVPLVHYGLIENMWNIGERLHLTERDRLWMGVSLFWGLGCENALFAVLTHGGCVVLQHSFDAGEALALIERERCTVYYGTQNMNIAIHEHPDRPSRDLSSLRTGATMGPKALQLAAEFGVQRVCHIYGLTEVYGNCCFTDADDPPEIRMTTSGRPLPGQDVVVADPVTHVPLPRGEVGEIKIRGYVMPGYYKDPAKNAESFDGDGYFLSGDRGRFDDRGNLVFLGRIKEMIKSGGINIAPVEIEEFLAGHAPVVEVYVVGVPDPVKEEVLAAVVVAETPGAPTEEALRTLCRTSLASYKVPRYFKFMNAADLPRTATGKVQKNLLREMFIAEAGTAEAPAAFARPAAKEAGS
jgi:fatty-acyl-CoA synthase